MGKIQMLKMLTTHLQFLGLLKKFQLGFPTPFLDFIALTDLVNLNFDFFFDLFEVPRIDTRLMFIFVAIGIPLGLMILTGVVFYSLVTILQIVSIIIGVVAIAGHILQSAAPDYVPDDIEANVQSTEFLIVGIVLCAGTILYRVGKYMEWKCNQKLNWMMHLIKPTSVVGGLAIAGFDLIAQKVGLGFSALLLAYEVWHSDAGKQKVIVMLALLGGAGYAIVKLEWHVQTPPQFFIPAVVLVALGVTDSIQSALGASSSGASRVFFNFRAKVQRFMDTTLLTLALFGLQAAFVPVVTFCLDMFLCADFKCQEGYKFNPFAPREADTFNTDEELFCDACAWINGCAYNVSDLCPAYNSRRLLKHPDVGCDENSFVLFLVSAILVLFVFCVVIMLLYRSVINFCAEEIVKEMRGPTTANKDPNADPAAEDKGFRLKSTVDPTTEYALNSEWENLLEKVDPKASSLYQAYRYEFRYFLLFECAHKILLVVASATLSVYFKEAVFALMLGNFCMFIVMVVLHPLLDELEHKLSIVLTLTETLSGIYAVCVWQVEDTFSTDEWAIAMIVICGIIPIFVSVVLMVVEVKNKFCGGEDGKSELEKLEEQMDKKLQESDTDESSDGEPPADGILKLQDPLLANSDEDEMLLLGIGPSVTPPTRPAAANARPRRRPRRTRPVMIEERELTSEEKKQLEKEKKKKEMTPEERMCDDLNARTKKIILRFFVTFAAPLLIVALVLTLFATLTSKSHDFLDASQVYDRTRLSVLNDYYTWDEFADNCCCLVTDHPSAQFNITERWVCRGASEVTSEGWMRVTAGHTVDRSRRMATGTDSGLPIRGVCEKDLVPQCTATLQDDNATVFLECNSTYVQHMNITERAILGLW
jgi:hypothetical protein